MTLHDRLMSVKDEEYRAFQVKLVPNIPPETILGVRTPDMRAIAKALSNKAAAFHRTQSRRCAAVSSAPKRLARRTAAGLKRVPVIQALTRSAM